MLAGISCVEAPFAEQDVKNSKAAQIAAISRFIHNTSPKVYHRTRLV